MPKTTLTEQELRKKLAAMIVAEDIELEFNSDGQIYLNTDFWKWDDGTYHTDPELIDPDEDEVDDLDDEDEDEDDDDEDD